MRLQVSSRDVYLGRTVAYKLARVPTAMFKDFEEMRIMTKQS